MRNEFLGFFFGVKLDMPEWDREDWPAMLGVGLAGGLCADSVFLLANAVDFFGDGANYALSLFVLGMAVLVQRCYRQRRGHAGCAGCICQR